MSRPTDLLKQDDIAKAKPRAKFFNLYDGHGLAVQVQPNGSKWWRFSYSRPITHKRNTLSLGQSKQPHAARRCCAAETARPLGPVMPCADGAFFCLASPYFAGC